MLLLRPPSHDCRHAEVVRKFIELLEGRLGEPLQYAAFSHHDAGTAPCHVTIRDPRSDPTSQRAFDRLEANVQDAAVRAYAVIRAGQREYARTRDQGRGHER